jgi:transcriptional regulator with XRE-family HTH domain
MNPLGAARRARGLSLADIANATRLSPRHVQAIDEGRFADLPAGIYGRAYVRAVARAVDLDAAELDSILSLLPPAPDPLPVLEEAAKPKVTRGPGARVARVCLAATLDALLLLVWSAVEIALVAAACRIRVATLLSAEPLPLFVLCVTTWVAYFILLAGVQGRTPGQRVCGFPVPHAEAPLSLGAILQRAARAGQPRHQ